MSFLECCSGSSDGYDSSSSCDGYDRSSSCRDTRKSNNRKYSLQCTCFCNRAHGNRQKVHKSSRNAAFRKLRKNANKHCGRLICLKNRKDHCIKHHAKRKNYKHRKPIDCICKAGDPCNGDLFGLAAVIQEPAEVTREVTRNHPNKRKREFEFTQESTSKRIHPLDLNLKSPVEESSSSRLDPTLKDKWCCSTLQKDQVFEKGAASDGEIHSQKACRSKSLQASGAEEYNLDEIKEEDRLKVSTTQWLLQDTFENFNYVLSCYEHLQKDTCKFDLNVAIIDENHTLDASVMSASQSCILEGSLANPHSPSPEESAKCKVKRKLFATNEESLVKKESSPDPRECCKEAEVASVYETPIVKENHQEIKEHYENGQHNSLEVSHELIEEIAKLKDPTKCSLLATNEKNLSQKVSLPDLEECCKEEEMASLRETQHEDIQTKEYPQEIKVQGENGQQTGLEVSPRLIKEGSGRKARKKRVICKKSLLNLSAFEDVGEGSTVAVQHQVSVAGGLNSSGCVVFSGSEGIVSQTVSMTFEPQRWDSKILCDLCHRGSSLSFGEWYSCCCGSRLQNCNCSVGSLDYDHDKYSCSGKVHKMCGLWSIKTYNKDGVLEGLSNIIKCGKLLKCARCKKDGATLRCRAKNCTQVFHYPCADMLASKLRCRMWTGPHFSVACHDHRYDTQFREGAEMILPNLKNAMKRVPQMLASNSASKCLSSKQQDFTEASELDNKRNQIENKVTTIQISSDSDDMPKAKCEAFSLGQYDSIHSKQQFGSIANLPIAENISQLRHRGTTRILYYLGNNLLCEDISGGCESMLIPCTNDVDSTPAPNITYMTRSRYLARAKSIFNSVLVEIENLALPCKGCNNEEVDNPHGNISCHNFLANGERHNDTRIDWQGQPMFGRLSYDQYGRLQVGPEIDIVECNSRCPCDFTCLNRELQKGLRSHLEIFRTKTEQWAVRTTEAIPRGKFIVELAGEILTHEEAHKRRGECNVSELSCFSTQGHFDSSLEDLLIIDWYKMSNVARFIRHSHQGNLRMHRVYTETLDTRFYRIGLYASRDVELGEELLCESSEGFNCKHGTINFPFATARRSDRLINSSE